VKLPKVYEPQQYEQDIYALWEKSQTFTPKHRASKDSFSIVMPPPNANGNLHIGHALTNALQDILIRYNRQKGKAVLYLPGADHAGFETWVVYEKELKKQGKTRFDFSREELYSQVWDFVLQNKHNFEGQIRRLGASCDWSRYTFTLDQKVVKRAYQTFKKMWKEGLIYRGERLVNFCTFHATAFADIEVVHKEEQGSLWYIRYPLTGGNGELTVATTRPETMFGDTAVAVHPDDKRYQQFIGKTVKLPLTNREIPVIADDFVDKKFGTGAVKITPAHDPNDFEAGQRHNLPMITVINHDGKMTHEAGEAYQNLSVEKARQKVVADLKKADFLAKVESHTNSVGHCYKCGTVIQPLLREQWFIDMQPLANRAIKALETGKIAFHPAKKQDQAITYLRGIKDWNISRQIAWGIPIPAFVNIDEPDDWIYDERITEEIIEVNGKTYHRDSDVFDTWFSSSQWPYVTLDYPGSDYKQFYPLDLMETGFDILPQWVCRMIMLGLYVTDEIPFKNVYLHGMVLDEHGKKMSKSKGNVINPMDIIDKYGSDALRMGVITGTTAGNNQPFGIPKVVAARNFCNKLWNIARYVEDKVGANFTGKNEPKPQTSADHWLLTKLQHLTDEFSADLDNYRFAEAYEKLYHTVWDDFADWYIESSKVEPNISVLAYALETILKLAHPFAPFITETIWQTLAQDKDTILATSPWPKSVSGNPARSKDFDVIKTIITEIRYLTTELQLKAPSLYYVDAPFIKENSDLIKRLARLNKVTEVKDGYGLRLTQTDINAWLDVDRQTIVSFQNQLKARKAELNALTRKLEDRLANKAYLKQAPKAIIDQSRTQLKQAREQIAKLDTDSQRFAS